MTMLLVCILKPIITNMELMLMQLLLNQRFRYTTCQRTKKHLSLYLPQRMNKDLMEEINAFDEVKSWFEMIKNLCEDSGM